MRRADSWHRSLVQGKWNATSLEGKELELLWEVEQYQRDIVGLTFMPSTGSGEELEASTQPIPGAKAGLVIQPLY